MTPQFRPRLCHCLLPIFPRPRSRPLTRPQPKSAASTLWQWPLAALRSTSVHPSTKHSKRAEPELLLNADASRWRAQFSYTPALPIRSLVCTLPVMRAALRRHCDPGRWLSSRARTLFPLAFPLLLVPLTHMFVPMLFLLLAVFLTLEYDTSSSYSGPASHTQIRAPDSSLAQPPPHSDLSLGRVLGHGTGRVNPLRVRVHTRAGQGTGLCARTRGKPVPDPRIRGFKRSNLISRPNPGRRSTVSYKEHRNEQWTSAWQQRERTRW